MSDSDMMGEYSWKEYKQDAAEVWNAITTLSTDPPPDEAAAQAAETAKQEGEAPHEEPMSLSDVESTVKANKKSGQSDELVTSIAWKESGFRAGAKNARTTATGLMQMTRGAAKDVGYDHGKMTDPAANIEAGSSYLANRIKSAGGDVNMGLDRYGTGPSYHLNLITCETCLKGAQSPAQEQDCLNQIHK